MNYYSWFDYKLLEKLAKENNLSRNTLDICYENEEITSSEYLKLLEIMNSSLINLIEK